MSLAAILSEEGKNDMERYVIDFFGLTENEAATEYPALYQHVLLHVKPQRDQVARKSHRSRWWIFGEPRVGLRKAIAQLSRFIVTVETSKHKPFVFLDGNICPDHKLYVIASDDAYLLGILSSRIHLIWALAAGGRLGVGNDPTWTNSTCFLPFPFPVASEMSVLRVRHIAEELDAHRKRQQREHAGLTLLTLQTVKGTSRRVERRP
jgi:hypothetical protein